MSTAISIMLMGTSSNAHVDTVTSSTAIVATFLLSTVPRTIETRATSGRRPRSRSADTRFTGSVSYDPPVPNPAMYTVAKYFQICGQVRFVISLTSRIIAASQTMDTMAGFSVVRP